MLAPNPNTKPPAAQSRPPKPIKAVGKRGKVYGVFPHAHAAAEALGVWRNSIISALRKGNRAAGYYWRYVGVPDDVQPLNNRLRCDRGGRVPIPARFLPREPEPPKPPSPPPVVHKGRNLDFSPPRHESVVERTPAEWERGRFDRARQFNPLLTWEHWVEITTKQPRGRKPKPRPNTETR